MAGRGHLCVEPRAQERPAREKPVKRPNHGQMGGAMTGIDRMMEKNGRLMGTAIGDGRIKILFEIAFQVSRQPMSLPLRRIFVQAGLDSLEEIPEGLVLSAHDDWT